jgi:hypothetical protein
LWSEVYAPRDGSSRGADSVFVSGRRVAPAASSVTFGVTSGARPGGRRPSLTLWRVNGQVGYAWGLFALTTAAAVWFIVGMRFPQEAVDSEEPIDQPPEDE